MGSDEAYDNRYFEGETVSKHLYGDPAELRRAEKDRRDRDKADAERWRTLTTNPQLRLAITSLMKTSVEELTAAVDRVIAKPDGE